MGNVSKNKSERQRCRPVGACEWCGKAQFTSRRAARAFARRVMPGEQLNAYLCGDYYHLGHLGHDVIKGRYTRDELYGGTE